MPALQLQLRLYRDNYHFLRSRVKYLGHVVGSGELRVDPDKVSAVADWTAPRDIKGV